MSVARNSRKRWLAALGDELLKRHSRLENEVARDSNSTLDFSTDDWDYDPTQGCDIAATRWPDEMTGLSLPSSASLRG